jgi:hypothetical protein
MSDKETGEEKGALRAEIELMEGYLRAYDPGIGVEVHLGHGAGCVLGWGKFRKKWSLYVKGNAGGWKELTTAGFVEQLRALAAMHELISELTAAKVQFESIRRSPVSYAQEINQRIWDLLPEDPKGKSPQ